MGSESRRTAKQRHVVQCISGIVRFGVVGFSKCICSHKFGDIFVISWPQRRDERLDDDMEPSWPWDIGRGKERGRAMNV